MKVYLVMNHWPTDGCTVYGVASSPEQAIHLVHEVQAMLVRDERRAAEDGLVSCSEHISVHELTVDQFHSEGA